MYQSSQLFTVFELLTRVLRHSPSVLKRSHLKDVIAKYAQAALNCLQSKSKSQNLIITLQESSLLTHLLNFFSRPFYLSSPLSDRFAPYSFYLSME